MLVLGYNHKKNSLDFFNGFRTKSEFCKVKFVEEDSMLACFGGPDSAVEFFRVADKRQGPVSQTLLSTSKSTSGASQTMREKSDFKREENPEFELSLNGTGFLSESMAKLVNEIRKEDHLEIKKAPGAKHTPPMATSNFKKSAQKPAREEISNEQGPMEAVQDETEPDSVRMSERRESFDWASMKRIQHREQNIGQSFVQELQFFNRHLSKSKNSETGESRPKQPSQNESGYKEKYARQKKKNQSMKKEVQSMKQQVEEAKEALLEMEMSGIERVNETKLDIKELKQILRKLEEPGEVGEASELVGQLIKKKKGQLRENKRKAKRSEKKLGKKMEREKKKRRALKEENQRLRRIVKRQREQLENMKKLEKEILTESVRQHKEIAKNTIRGIRKLYTIPKAKESDGKIKKKSESSYKSQAQSSSSDNNSD